MFDFDGVLVDSLKVYSSAFLDACRECGIDHIQTKEKFLGIFDTNMFEGMARAGFSAGETEKVLDVMDSHLEKAAPHTDLFPGVKDMLLGLSSRCSVVVITSNLASVVSDFLQARGLNAITEIVGSQEEKSKVKKIQRAMANRPACQSYYVGDTAGDMTEAKKAGAKAVGAAWGWHGEEKLKAAGADLLCKSPKDLINLGQR